MTVKENKYFKAFIRVVKSLKVATINDNNKLEHSNIIREPLIIAKDKDHVKQIMLNKYPQFFQKNKVYMRETKDKAQFFYLVIFELYEYEKQLIAKGEWICSYCGQKHENRYISNPVDFEEMEFCRNTECLTKYKEEHFFINADNLDDRYFVGRTPIFIYKITEKTTGKSYVGKTQNHAIFRWWAHLTKNSSPFGQYLRSTKLSDWTFEVIEELPFATDNKEVLKIESEYILKYNSIENGFNSLISNKEVNQNKY